MKRLMRLSAGLWTASLLHADLLYACTVCFGNPESKTTQAARLGVIVMLVVTTMVLSGIGGVAIAWHRRARALRKKDSSASLSH